MNWLSYGGGVNSTALAILLCEGKLPQYEPWRILFSDTGDEKPGTYAFIQDSFQPYLARFGRTLEICRPKETVLERFERLKVTGSRLLRTCTENGKVKPMRDYRLLSGEDGPLLLGIDASEAHRRPNSIRPLVDLDIDRDECVRIIQLAGLPTPIKSGCWHCPFSRVGDIFALISQEPCKAARIERLEIAATQTHGPTLEGEPRTQWGDKPVSWWRKRVEHGGKIVQAEQQILFEHESTLPCDCYDG